MKVNLGCPKYCEGWTCVDLNPRDQRVVRCDAIYFLKLSIDSNLKCITEIRAKNLLEHLENVGSFFQVASEALVPHGVMTIITDNAEWLPYYIPVIHRLGWGAHSSDKYSPRIMNTTEHYSLFTKLHLQHYARNHNFVIDSIKRTCFGARLEMKTHKWI